jgi:putative ABC transport system ATP-binding protein
LSSTPTESHIESEIDMTQQLIRTATSCAVTARDLVKVYGQGATEVRALDGVTLDIRTGTFTAVMGPSGSGKSTLMHVLAGLDTPDAGSVDLGGSELTALNERRRTLLRRDRLGFVFQAFNLVPALTAAENIALPVTLAGRRPDADWFDRLVRTLGIADRLTHRPAELSGGQQQRVAVARALVNRPEIVFADEPTGNLDRRHGAALLGFLREATDAFGQTIVMVTHDPAAAAFADEVVFLADGRVVDTITQPTASAVADHLLRLEQHQEG